MKKLTAIAIADKRKMNVKNESYGSEQTYRKSLAKVSKIFEKSKKS